MRSVFLTALFTAFFLAGCSAEEDDGADEDGDHDHMDEHTYMLHMSDVPATVAPGAQFEIENMIGGHLEATSDHIGAHFWNATQAHPTENLATSTACVHQAGDMPATYMVTCTAPMEPGTYYIRAHARGMEHDETFHWWSDEESFVVA
jgi:hypothetical protein